MPKLVPTIAVTVIRDGKRVTLDPTKKKAFSFSSAEVEQIKAIHPTAFRKPVNESDDSDDEATGTDATAPEGDASATANKTPKQPAKKKAAEKDSSSKKATDDSDRTSGEPKNTDNDGDDDDAEDDDL